MRAIKRDFVNPDTPSYCDNRKLTSGKAYFLLDDAGRIFKAGEQCAKQHSQTDLSSVPDLTTSLLVNSTKDKLVNKFLHFIFTFPNMSVLYQVNKR